MTIIVSDTTSLIALEGLQSLTLLCEVFEKVLLPKAVLRELEVGSPNITDQLSACGCIDIVEVPVSELLSDLKLVLDVGESEAIALAITGRLPLLIDERKGRSIARQHQLVVTGFAGLLLLAVKKNVLTSVAAIALLDQAIVNGFRLSEKLYQQVRVGIQG